jgi:serpin B
MLYELTGNEGADTHNQLAIANAVFVDNEVTLKKAFAQSFLDYYRGAAMNVDFKDPAAIDAINGWASEHTGGLIKDIVKEIPDETVVALANAIYFSDRWAWEFDEEETEEMTFHGAKNDVTAPFMLREGDALSYYEDNALQGINLNFKTGGGLYILLPRDGDADALLQGMTAERFAEIVKDTRPATGKLLLPRFELLSDFKLNDALKQLGVPLLDPDTAPVSGLVEETDTYIAASLHQAMISVDEKGTTAAAVTVEMMAGTSLPMPTEPVSMVCDRPFVFVLHRWTADAGEQVLFTGVVNQL